MMPSTRTPAMKVIKTVQKYSDILPSMAAGFMAKSERSLYPASFMFI